MKKIIVTIMAMVTFVIACGFTSEAKTTDLAERNVVRFIYDLEDDYDDASEEFKETIQMDVTYDELGYGIYDVCVTFSIEDDDFEYHCIYDGIEDDYDIEYGVYRGKRYDIYDMEELMELLYPEFADM